MIKSKKLSSLVAASLILAGGTVFGVQPAGAADTAQQILELQQGVNSNRQRISQLESAQASSQDYSKDIADNKAAIADEATARGNGDKSLNDRISSLKDAVYTDLDKESKAREAETAARIGADKAQDKVIEQVNQNVANGFDNINKNIGTITTQLNQQDANEAAARQEADTKETKARQDADATEATARENGDKSLNDRISSLKDAVYTDLDKESKAREAETAARIGADKAQDKVIEQVNQNVANGFDNINKNIGTITTQLNQQDANEAAARKAADTKLQGNIDKAVSDQAAINKNVQDTLNNSGAVASAEATKAANDAAKYARDTAKGFEDRLDVISGNQDITSESDLIKKDQSIGQNLTNVDTALHKEIAARIGADKAQDKVIEQVNKNVADGFNDINKNVAAGFTALNQADANEATERKDADSQLNTKMTNGFAAIQGQQDEQDAKIGKNKKDIQTNAGKIQNNQDAIKANSGRLDNHEGRIAGNETNIATNATNISKEISDRQDADTALQKNIDKEASERKDADSQLNTKMTNGFAAIQGQQDEQDAKIGKNKKDIQTNAGKIQNNQDAIKANSDRLDNHEGRIAGNENNIATNAEAIKKETNARIDADQQEAQTRGDKDKEHDTAIAANKKAIGDEAAARQADVSRLDNKIHDVSKEVDTVGALSMAMSGLHPLSYDEGDARFQLSAAVGTYDGTEALALGGFYHFNRDSMLSVGVATDLGADEHRMGANVGYTRRIGQGGHVSRPSEGTVSDIMKDIKNLEQKQAKLEQENEQLKQQLAALKK